MQQQLWLLFWWSSFNNSFVYIHLLLLFAFFFYLLHYSIHILYKTLILFIHTFTRIFREQFCFRVWCSYKDCHVHALFVVKKSGKKKVKHSKKSNQNGYLLFRKNRGKKMTIKKELQQEATRAFIIIVLNFYPLFHNSLRVQIKQGSFCVFYLGKIF